MPLADTDDDQDGPRLRVVALLTTPTGHELVYHRPGARPTAQEIMEAIR